MLFTYNSSQLGAERGCTSWYNPQEVLQVVRYVKAGERWSWGKNSLNIKLREEMSEDEIEVEQLQLMLKNWGLAAISTPRRWGWPPPTSAILHFCLMSFKFSNCRGTVCPWGPELRFGHRETST